MQIEKATDYQTLFWHMWHKEPKNASLALNYIFKIQGTLDVPHLKQVLVYYLSIHTECNDHFYNEMGTIYKKKLAPISEPLLFADLRAQPIQYEKYLHENFLGGINIHTGPLYKFLLIQLNNTEYIFAFAFSHLIFDGTSYQKFCNIVEKLYNHPVENWRHYDFKQTLHIKDYNESNIQFWQAKLKNLSLQQPLNFAEIRIFCPYTKKIFQT